MEHNVRYLAEEVAEDYAAGLVSRREALRHMSVLGLSTVAASAVLAACGGGGDDGEAASQPAPTRGPVTTAAGPGTTTAAVPVQDITYPGPGITLMGVFATAATPRGAVLVIHENRGITDFVRAITGRLAGSGYSALAVDLLSAQGGTARFNDVAELQSALVNNATERATDDMKASLEELSRRAPGQKLGATGFCFGGNMTYQLLNAGDPPALAAAVPFYGAAQNTDFSRTRAAVMAVYAENDARVNATREAVRSGLEQARLTHDIKTYPGTSHAFMNHTGNNYNEAQANAAYSDMAAWFGRHLA
jgi:carboxymethylenebutenolidase